MKYKDFTDFLTYKFGVEEPAVLDDDWPDRFNDWLADLDVDILIGFADQYAKEQVTDLRSMLWRATEALNHYADEANWGNGGWEGHPNDFFNPSRLKADRAWVVAKQVLSEIRGVK